MRSAATTGQKRYLRVLPITDDSKDCGRVLVEKDGGLMEITTIQPIAREYHGVRITRTLPISLTIWPSAAPSSDTLTLVPAPQHANASA